MATRPQPIKIMATNSQIAMRRREKQNSDWISALHGFALRGSLSALQLSRPGAGGHSGGSRACPAAAARAPRPRGRRNFQPFALPRRHSACRPPSLHSPAASCASPRPAPLRPVPPGVMSSKPSRRVAAARPGPARPLTRVALHADISAGVPGGRRASWPCPAGRGTRAAAGGAAQAARLGERREGPGGFGLVPGHGRGPVWSIPARRPPGSCVESLVLGLSAVRRRSAGASGPPRCGVGLVRPGPGVAVASLAQPQGRFFHLVLAPQGPGKARACSWQAEVFHPSPARQPP